MQKYIDYLRGLSDQALTESVENIFYNDSTDGQALAGNEIVLQLIQSEALPLAAFEKAALLEFVWRGLTIDQEQLRIQLQGDYGVDLKKEVVDERSTRELN